MANETSKIEPVLQHSIGHAVRNVVTAATHAMEFAEEPAHYNDIRVRVGRVITNERQRGDVYKEAYEALLDLNMVRSRIRELSTKIAANPKATDARKNRDAARLDEEAKRERFKQACVKMKRIRDIEQAAEKDQPNGTQLAAKETGPVPEVRVDGQAGGGG